MGIRKDNASLVAGASVDRAGGPKATKKKQRGLRCGVSHISKLRRELQSQGLSLRDTSGRTQCETLLRVLQYLGPRGINTPEAVGCGFYRVATRVQELEADGWIIASHREAIIGADGLTHVGIARYILLRRRSSAESSQGTLNLEVPA